MKTKVEIFSSQKLKNFFINLNYLFDINLKDFDELEGDSSTNLSIVFFDHQNFVDEKTLNSILLNENFIESSHRHFVSIEEFMAPINKPSNRNGDIFPFRLKAHF